MLSIKYLINLLNDHKDIQVDRNQYFVDSYPTLKIESNISYNNLLTCLLIAYKNVSYNINSLTYKISINDDVIKEYKQIIQKYIIESSFDQTKKKKYIANHLNQNDDKPTNDSILVLTNYFGINLLIYSSDSQIIKCYYYDNYMDRDQPFIILKETKDNNSPELYYEIVFSQNKFIFEYSHPIVIELLPKSIIIGLEPNKQLEYLEQNIDAFNDQIINKNPEIIKLKMIPSRILKLLQEYQTMNFNFIKLK